MIAPFSIVKLPLIKFGPGLFATLPALIASYGNRALIMTGGHSLKQSGRLDLLCRELERLGVNSFLWSVREEPTPAVIDAAAAEFRGKKIGVLAAIGGGSVLDAGKAVSAMLCEESSVYDYLEDVGGKQPSGNKVAFIAVPTTAGTGSEATKNAVIRVPGKDGFKKSLRHDHYVPNAALVDPELTLSLPEKATIHSGLDALSQLVESYLSTKANAFTDSLALGGIERFQNGFLSVLKNPQDLSGRADLSYAALVSGITLAHAGLAAVHGMAGVLGGPHAVPHGAACGTLLWSTLQVTYERMRNDLSRYRPFIKKLARLGKIFGSQAPDDLAAAGFFIDVLEKITAATKIARLREFGITAADLAEIASASNNKNNPYPLTKEDRNRILKMRI